MRPRHKALITGSGGLVGSACTEFLSAHGWEVIGIDNDMRRTFFGAQGSTTPTIERLVRSLPLYRHHSVDIRDRNKIRNIFRAERPDFIIHAAAQPSHDKAASIPYDDFDVNATGTLNILVAAKDYCAESPICFTSTNKVYGDRPNSLPLIEHHTRYDYADGRIGIDETLSIDASLHSLFGASKVAGDMLCQEFGRYFGMPVGIFRCGCVTGPQHAAVELHGFLAHIIMSAVRRSNYTVYGYKGKQVRDQIHCDDVASIFLEYYHAPRPGEIYNLGGGRNNSLSILETIEILSSNGFPLHYKMQEKNRVGDHICYITDLTKLQSHYPDWLITYDIRKSIDDILKHHHDAAQQFGDAILC
jgi:CDP-paratose 2-epimerase